MPQFARSFFTKEQQDDILQAILNAELDTSGEIRVHIENKCSGDLMERAAYIFKKLEMDRTQLKNGVLFYLAIKNRSFAILGDSGIDSAVPDNFWESTKVLMINHFRDDHFSEGLIKGIQQAGLQLKKHFPYQSDDINELKDDISFGDD